MSSESKVSEELKITTSTSEDAFEVASDRVKYSDDEITSEYFYDTNKVTKGKDGKFIVKPISVKYNFRTKRKIPRVGVMLVGWGGNNGSTLTAGLIANAHNIKWNTKSGEQSPDYMGSVTQSSTVRIGSTPEVCCLFFCLILSLSLFSPSHFLLLPPLLPPG
jgi:myo-inositol-1-phosphate synthase